MYKFLGTYQVIPSLPQELEKLREIAYNLYWSWSPKAAEVFRRLDRELWIETNHNPVMLLGMISQARLEEAARDDGFKAHMDRVYNELQQYLFEKTWFQKFFDFQRNFHIVYFSAEFGLTECMQLYSGGLGVLSGDHLKAASDLGIPLIGMGLLYKVGYFRQYLDSDGWQHEQYDTNDFDNLPLKRVEKENGENLILYVSIAGREVFFQVWKVQVGRVPLYLLDTNILNNTEADRKITETLYGGNVETRMEQEIVLGIGGIKTLNALGIDPVVCHMNEGHSAFMALERIRLMIKNQGLTFREAKEIGFHTNIFTTHTPVPAGIDVFSNDLVEKYLGLYYRNELNISGSEFYSLGNIFRNKDSSVFNMAHFAINNAGYINGVSKLHSEVSRKMWFSGFKDVPFNEIPIDYITNGIHTRSHLSREMEDLLLQYLGEKWVDNPSINSIWERVDSIPDEELWRIHERRRERLVAFTRKRLIRQIKNRGGSQNETESAMEVLNPAALTIGFARRFATYKRATLIFRDIDRLSDILNNKNNPVQIIIAGRAHPKDEEGKHFIQEIVQIAKEERFRRKVVFIENYDLNVASYLVQGCDIWLNNPRRPLEASGTSGMKVIANGGLNLSVLDGWWVEGFDPEVGWKIGNGEEYNDPDYQDEVESREIYNALESHIVPLFYKRGEDHLPREWIAKVKNSMKKLGPFFNTHRMLQEYFTKYYVPAYKNYTLLSENNGVRIKELAAWKENVIGNWSQLKVIKVETSGNSKQIFVGEEFPVKAEISLGNLTPDDVQVEIFYGPMETSNNKHGSETVKMEVEPKPNKSGNYKYSGCIKPSYSGQQGFTIRILPKHEQLINPFELGVIYWAS
ncbi:MAG TPA: alpha-glucan family phosphorylase [Ignavibacteriaceae bacterium]|nr:alpha-glucan family phosphorylase [Ignavibacteriaceae bacterium]